MNASDYLTRDQGGRHYPRWMTPTELLRQLELVRSGIPLYVYDVNLVHMGAGPACPDCGADRAWYHEPGWRRVWLLHWTNKRCPHNARPLCPSRLAEVRP